MTDRVYLDWNATAPLRPQARAAMLAALEQRGNPSSIHADGRAARTVIEDARARVAGLVGGEPRNVVFTSGGSEANMLALAPANGCGRLLVSAIEHISVLGGGRFPADSVVSLPVKSQGGMDLDALESSISNGLRPLVSIMLANNETGVIQPVRAAADRVHAAGGLLHVDAVQAAGRIPININQLQCDLLTISGHKIGGPQGVGALIRRDENIELTPLIRGGGQERGLRAGTENVAAIAGLGAAAAAALDNPADSSAHLRRIHQRLDAGLRRISPTTVIFGEEAERVPNTILFAVPGIKAETALIALDLEGISVSSGSACSSGKVAPSHVLAAMGVERELAAGAIRVSTGYSTTESDIDRFLQAWRTCVATLGKGRQGMAA